MLIVFNDANIAGCSERKTKKADRGEDFDERGQDAIADYSGSGKLESQDFKNQVCVAVVRFSVIMLKDPCEHRYMLMPL